MYGFDLIFLRASPIFGVSRFLTDVATFENAFYNRWTSEVRSVKHAVFTTTKQK